MAAEARQKIVSVALDMTNMLINMGLPEPKVREKAPPILFDLPPPKPLREPLLKLKLRKETVNRLNHIYISRTNEYLEATIRELQLLWSSVYVEGSHAPLRIWDKVILSAQEETQKTLDDMFDMVVASARDHVANLATMKRKSQPVFDQRIIDFLLWYFANPNGSQNPSQDEKKKLAGCTGLTYKQIDIWFQNRRARTKKRMAKSGITDLREALGNPKRPDFANLPDPMRKMLTEKKQTRKEMKILNRRFRKKVQERAGKPKRVKIELTRSLLREENSPPLDWLCSRAQAEKAIRDMFISGELQGIDSWSAPVYAYPTEWSKEVRNAWWQVDMLHVAEFEHKSTPHPDKPKEVTVTDEEMDALTKQFAGLKIEVLKKIYWHQYPDGRLEAIHPKLVRVRKDGTFFMYDDEELQDSPKHTPTYLPRPTRPRRGDHASQAITVDQPGTSASHPIIKGSGSSGQEPIVLDIPRASAAVPIPGISVSGPMIVDGPGASASYPIVVGTTEVPAAPSAPPQPTNPMVIVSIPEATEEDMGMANQVKVRTADESKVKGRTTEFAMPAPSSPAVGDAAFSGKLDMFIAEFGLSPSSPHPGNVQNALPPGIFNVPEPGTLPAEYLPANSAPSEVPAVYPVHTNQPYTREELEEFFGGVNLPQPHIFPADSAPPEVPDIDPVHIDQRRTLDEVLAEFFESMKSYNVSQVQVLPANSAPPEVPAIDPVHIDHSPTLDEGLAEFFESISTYHVHQAQILSQCDSDWNAVFAPPTVATVYQPITGVSGREWTWWDGPGPPSCRLQHLEIPSTACLFPSPLLHTTLILPNRVPQPAS